MFSLKTHQKILAVAIFAAIPEAKPHFNPYYNGIDISTIIEV